MISTEGLTTDASELAMTNEPLASQSQTRLLTPVAILTEVEQPIDRPGTD